MSIQQRLINKYIAGLDMQTSFKTQLHFLLSETDEAAKHMLKENLNKIAESTGNHSIAELVSKVAAKKTNNIIYGGYVNELKAKKKLYQDDSSFNMMARGNHSDYGQRGNIYFSQLYLENALRMYEKDAGKHGDGDPHFAQRAEIYLLLENYVMAYTLAAKINQAEIAFVSAVCLQNYKLAATYVNSVLSLLSSRNVSLSVISAYELFQLICFVMLATAPARQVTDIYQHLASSMDFDLDLPVALITSLSERRYSELYARFPAIQEALMRSVYTRRSAGELIAAIHGNILANLVEPFAKIRFPTIYALAFCSRDDLIRYLVPLIESGRVDGRLDLIHDEFIGGGVVGEEREMKETLHRTIIVKNKLSKVIFQKDYMKQNSKSTHKVSHQMKLDHY